MKECMIKGYVIAAQKLEGIKQNLKRILKDEDGKGFDDGGTFNWMTGMVVSIVLIGLVFGLMKAFAPEVFNQLKTKVLEFFK